MIYRPAYVSSLLAYTAGALLSGTIVGGLLGAVGSYLSEMISERGAWLLLSAVGLAFASREFELLRFPVPQWPRQTNKVWGNRFGFTAAAWSWGVDLGSGLTTIVTYSGYWILVLAAVLKGDVVYGAVILAMFALGRVSSVVIVPHMLESDRSLLDSLRGLPAHRPDLQRWHRYSLVALAAGLATQAVAFR